MRNAQAIQNPHGVTVFGSHVVRVRPDRAVVVLGINRIAKAPGEALADARAGATAVRAVLAELGVPANEIRSSRIGLNTKYRRSGGERTFVGHEAIVQINVTIRELDGLETVLVRTVEAGADEVSSVRFKTSKLADHRATARRSAVAAARAKAELYAGAAGVELGRVLHIEDVDPTTVRASESSMQVDADSDDDGGGAYDPGTIGVGGRVVVSFALA